jgi:hypothetical protein
MTKEYILNELIDIKLDWLTGRQEMGYKRLRELVDDLSKDTKKEQANTDILTSSTVIK